MENKINNKIYFAVYFQIFLMLSLTFFTSISFSSLIKIKSLENNFNYTESQIKGENIFIKALRIFNKIFWNEKNLVSAVGIEEAINAAEDYLYNYNGSLSTNSKITGLDLEKGVYTCPLDKNGRYCQEYPASSCETNCNVSCIPTPSSQSSICKPGTCYDSKEGSCSIGATRQICESSLGLWFSDPLGNINVCKAGCCVLGEKTLFITEAQCTKEASAIGIEKWFRPELKTEISCLALSKISQKEGACLIKDNLGTACRFTTETNCKMNIKGEFHEGYLCSHPDLNTKCIKQKTIACEEGKEEVYFFDSCGNRENIYSVNKEQSYNNGKILSKENSCVLDINNKYSQSTCGNCNRLGASVCGLKTATEKLSESSAEFVCKDLRCRDEKGEVREHGESWCVSQSSIGLDAAIKGERATNSVGGRSFKRTCFEGELITEPCADYNNEICTQSNLKREDGKEITTSACRINRGYECYQYNEEGKKEDCTKNPDCFIKKVEVGSQFKFEVCAPKITPGFDFKERESSANLCSIASQKCDVVEVKGLSGWKCKANCACKNTQLFAEQMNDLCISIGDCGTKANYAGDLTVNHNLFYIKSKKGTDQLGSEIGGKYGGLSTNYINKITNYANEKGIKDNFIEAANIEEFYGELGIPGTLNPTGYSPEDKTAAVISQVTTISGAMGLLMMAAGTNTGMATLTTVLYPGGFVPSSFAPTFSAFAGALTGASIAFAALSFLISWSGIGNGLPPAITYGLLLTGAAGGAILGIAAMQGGGLTSVFALSGLPVIGWALIVGAVIIIGILSILGIGKIRHKTYTFQCLPWQAPSGGSKCSECGNDGYPCSKYSCESLGQNCQLINENTQDPECIAVAKDDVLEPVIRLNESYLDNGIIAEYFDNGVKIKTNTQDGCIPESYSLMLAGIDINEAAKCEILSSPIDLEIGGTPLSLGLYKKLHVLPLTVPPLSTYGLENFNPNSSAQKNYYIRCEDKNGNKNIRPYSINFCIMPGKDTFPPKIQSREPINEIVKHDSSEINASIFTNEPAECRWSIEDKDYENMENNFDCLNEFSQRESLYGWRCKDSFNLDQNEKTFFVRCKDQPWILNETDSENDFEGDPKLMRDRNTGEYGCFGCEESEEGQDCRSPSAAMIEVVETNALYCDDWFNVTVSNRGNNTERNVNNESYQLKFRKAEKALSIDYINIDNKTFEYNTTPASVEIIAKTSGGFDGSAICSYLWGSTEIPFMDTLSKEHRQVSPAYVPGKYSLTIKCKDVIGEIAERTANFEIKIDDSAPKITRVYSEIGTLYVVTDEHAECYYKEDVEQNCYFDILNNNSTKKMSGENLVHTLLINYGMTYNIKCVDDFSHYPGDCSAVIKGVER